MATLHVRDVPDKLYGRIRRLARARNRSLSAQVTMLLDEAMRAEERRNAQAEILAEAKRFREALNWNAAAPESSALIREDRDR